MTDTATPQNFAFRGKWLVFSETLKTPSERLAFLLAVMRYGGEADEPQNLGGRAKDYFNEVVRPDIDRQRHTTKTPKQ